MAVVHHFGFSKIQTANTLNRVTVKYMSNFVPIGQTDARDVAIFRFV